MTRVEKTLASHSVQLRPISLPLIEHWMHDLREVRYGYSLQWKTPAEVANSPVADCKGKAVALYQHLRLNGAQNFLLIIGRRAPTSKLTHTWVEWTTSSGSYVLDPTFNCKALEISKIPAEGYVPYYAFSGTRKYRAIEMQAVCATL